MSIGGSAVSGWALILHGTLAEGGKGGNIYNNKVALNRVILDGADADIDGVSVRGLGGGSVYGGLSIGGAGYIAGDGGAGGTIYDNEVVLYKTALTGGSVNSYSIGGGSIYGGLSLGGSWEKVYDDEYSTGRGEMAATFTQTKLR